MHMQSLHIKISPLPCEAGKPLVQWSQDELQVMEQFFDFRVAAPPYRPSSLNGFGKTLSLPPIVLKDVVQLMRLDLQPEILQPNAKWNLQFCMRVPPTASSYQVVPVGYGAVLTCREKILFFLQVTRIYMPGIEWKDSMTLVLPVVHVVTKNVTQLACRENVPILHAANEHMKRFAEYNLHNTECSLFPVVRDLLMNFILPNEIPSALTNQMVSSPMGASPSPLMHSPMQAMNQGGNAPVGIPVQAQSYGGMGGV